MRQLYFTDENLEQFKKNNIYRQALFQNSIFSFQSVYFIP